MTYQIEVKKDFDGDKTTHRNRIYRQNVKLEGPDIEINFPFHGETDPSDGKLKVLAHEDQSHPDNTVFRRKTIRCRFPQCPKDNILWLDYKNRIPYLEKNGELIPSGWWKYSTEHIEKTFQTFLSDINDELDVIRDTEGKNHGFKDRRTNDSIDAIIRDNFPKSLLSTSKSKLHNILWHCLTSGEGLRVYHIMLSPPQDQDYVGQESYQKLKAKANRLFIKAGGWGGVMVMHHARVRDRFNDPDSPSYKGFQRRDDGEGFHFHAIGLGFFRYEEWESSGWVIKNLSYNEKEGIVIPVRSVRATAEYLLEHCSVVTKKSYRSLSCHTAFLTPLTQLSYPSDLTFNLDLTSNIFDKGHEKKDTIQKPNEIGTFPISIVSGNNEIRKKSHTRKVRNYSTYWFIGCLKNLKLPKEPTKCALTDHEIKKNTEFRIVLHRYKEVLVAHEESPFVVEFNLKEEEIDPMEFEKTEFLTKIPTGVDRILDDGILERESSIFGRQFKDNDSDFDYEALKEACYRFRLADPQYAWFKIPHIAYYTDILDPDAKLEMLRMEIQYYSFKQQRINRF